MTTDEYGQFVEEKWLGFKDIRVRDIRDLYICTAGLGGETGEVLEKLKKYVRDGTLDLEILKKELGDVLYYLTYIGRAFGFTLDEIIMANVNKLNDRLARGTMRGSGDLR
jgi:NTP pyrophosphatase (non-canonical NTP hydrolase)